MGAKTGRKTRGPHAGTALAARPCRAYLQSAVPASPAAPAASRVASAREFGPIAVPPDARVFVLTGAGISAESGIRTFRDANGLWEQYRFEEVASPEGWAADAVVVWRFYAQRRAQATTCQPNPAHRALADLERALGDRLFLCTQNVDDLHEKAGHRRLVHMHGELMKSRCESCSRPPFHDEVAHPAVPRCDCGARVRPHIVWFGEVPFEMDRIARELDACDVFVTVGSSGAVYPAAGFVSAVRARSRRGARVKTVYVGPEEPDNASMFDECRLGRAGDVVPTLFETAGPYEP
jgi:NAD-dependent deacetylase